MTEMERGCVGVSALLAATTQVTLSVVAFNTTLPFLGALAGIGLWSVLLLFVETVAVYATVWFTEAPRRWRVVEILFVVLVLNTAGACLWIWIMAMSSV